MTQAERLRAFGIEVVRSAHGRTWDVRVDGVLIEGGFFWRSSAVLSAEAYAAEREDRFRRESGNDGRAS